MSDNDSDTQPHSKSNNLGIDQIQSHQQNQNNMFSYQNRSRRGSSNKSSDHDQDKHKQVDSDKEDQNRQQEQSAQWKKSSKLSDILGESNEDHQNQQTTQQNVQRKQAIHKVEEQVQKIQNIVHQRLEQQKSNQQQKDKNQGQKKQTVSQEKLNEFEVKIQINDQKQNKNNIETVEALQTQQKIQESNKNESEKENVQATYSNESKKEELKQEKQQKQKYKIIEEKEKQIQQVIVDSHIQQKQLQNSTDKKPQNEVINQILDKNIIKLEPQKIIEKKQADKQYQKQLEDDLAMLKKGMKNNKKGSQKESQKNRVNKTLMPMSNPRQLQFQQTPQIKAFELKMITMMAQEKKKQNYLRLRQWDKRREQSLAIHKNMIQLLHSQIDKRIKSSIQNLEIYTTFLREKAKQQEKYVGHPVINTKYALQNNSISKSVYINCTVILNSLSDENAARCRKINDFIHLIRNDILRDSIDAHLLQSQKELLRVREKISNLKASCRKYNTETQEKSNQLSLFFNENSTRLNVEADRDFFATQLEFLQKASQQTQIQKRLGQSCLQYLQTAINQQVKRSKVIREAMVTFSKALQQCYNVETDPAEIEQLSKAEQNKLIQQFYSLQQIFDERCLSVFKAHENIENTKMLTVEMFSSFLKKFEFQGFDSRVLLLKQFQAKYHPSGKNQIQKQQNCYVVITVDRLIHLFFSKEKTDIYAKPDVSIKATMKNLQLKQVKSQMLDIIIKDQKRNSMISYFWQSKNNRVYRLEFQKKDSREEFIDYISKIRG